MKKLRDYSEYKKIISNLYECSDETLREIVMELREFCMSILNMKELVQQHNNKVNTYYDDGLLNVREIFEFKPVDELSRVELLTELCFEVNKVSKDIDLNDYGKVFFEKSLKERQEIRMSGIKGIFNEKYSDIYKNLYSQTNEKKKKGIEIYLNLTEDEEKLSEFFFEYMSNQEFWYKLKSDILFQIVKELAKNPEKYKDYRYGIIIDKEAATNGTNGNREYPLLAISIPGHEATYQFHLKYIEDAVYNVDSVLNVQHPFAKLVKGDRQINKKQIDFTINNILNAEDKKKLEDELEELKSKAKQYKTVEEIEADRNDVFRKIQHLSLLLMKDLKQQLNEVSELAANNYISEQKVFFEDGTIKCNRSVADEKKRKDIIDTVLKYNHIFYVSPTLDSYVAVEIIKDEAAKRKAQRIYKKRIEEAKMNGEDLKSVKPLTKDEIQKIKDNIQVDRIKAAEAPESDDTKVLNKEEKGLYINSSKNGYYKKTPISKNVITVGKDVQQVDTNKKRKSISEMIKVDPDENLRESSVCELLSRYGFDVPNEIVKCANNVKIITKCVECGSKNAYLLADSLRDGKEIMELCNEVTEMGGTLDTTSLSDEQIKKYGVKDIQEFYEKDIIKNKKDLRYIYFVKNESDDGEKIQVIKEEVDEQGNKFYIPECNIEEQTVKRKIAINKNENPGQLAFYVAYAEDVDFCISINETKEKNVQFAIQSNPEKSNLPWKIRNWTYKKTKEALEDQLSPVKDVSGVLNERTRIIVGGRNCPDICFKDNRENKEGSFLDYTINEIIEIIKNDEIEKEDKECSKKIFKKILDVIDENKVKEQEKNSMYR